MIRISFWLMVCLLGLCCQLPVAVARATTQCVYNFTSGSGNSYLSYCMTVNGNIPEIVTPQYSPLINYPFGEGYGICNESPAQNYTDYGVSDTGNWHPATLLSHTLNSVEIARTTSDGHWSLTQTIILTGTPTITVVMALRNNQPIQKVAYLVRFADTGPSGNASNYVAGFGGAFGFSNGVAGTAQYGLLLQNAARPPFGFWQGYVQTVTTGPNACAFAYNAAQYGTILSGSGSIEVAYVGAVPAGGTKTITLIYRGS